MERMGGLLRFLDACCLAIFVVEILMKVVGQRFSFFRSGWNVFDFLIVAIALVPASGPLAILRALRILRVLRLVTHLHRLRTIVESVLRSLPSIGWICGLLLMVFYIFSVLTTTLFGPAFPNWFGSIGASMYTLFQILTLDSWSSGIVRPTMERFPHAYLLFIPFVLMTSFIVLNVFIGIIVSNMSEVTAMNKAANSTGLPPADTLENNEGRRLTVGHMEGMPAFGDTSGQSELLEKELTLLKEQIARVENLLAARGAKIDAKKPLCGPE
jgi:voltage-gated sodium channel